MPVTEGVRLTVTVAVDVVAHAPLEDVTVYVVTEAVGVIAYTVSVALPEYGLVALEFVNNPVTGDHVTSADGTV